MIYQLKNEIMTIDISSLGAEMVSVKKNGKERLWQNDNGTWSGHAPVLFPKCGDCRVIIDGKEYPMRGHGIACRSEFTCVERTETYIKFTCSSSEETKKVYPYDYIFTVTYLLDGAKLRVEYEIYNPSDAPMYASLGSHESYSLDSEIDEYEAVFSEEEDFTSLIHTSEARGLTGESVSFGSGKRLRFPKEFMEDNSLIFENVKSKEVEVWKIGGERVCKVWFDGFDVLLFWRPEGSKMVCVEPWLNLPDLTTQPIGDFREKYGVQKVEGKETKTFVHTIEY